MGALKVAVVVGSLRKDSYNRRLAEALMAMAPQDLEFYMVGIGDLPLYNQDDDDAPAASVREMKAALGQAQAVLFVTPEYNRSMPGVLKNALDHGSRPYGQSVWAGKAAAVVGMSPGAAGTAMAQQHLRNVLSYLDMRVMTQPEIYLQYKDGFFEESGAIAGRSRDFMQGWMDKFAAWVRDCAGR